jgi:hypothetical protein
MTAGRPCESGTVTRQLAPERPAAIELTEDSASPTGMVAAAAAVRGAAVAVSGAILAAGLALVLWAVTPASGAEPEGALQGGVVAFAAANLMPVTIGGVVFTLPPLLLTLVVVGLLAATARRGRFLPAGRYQETVSVAVTAGSYGLVVAAITRGFGPPEAVPAGWVWIAGVLALVASAAGMLGRGSSWRRWWSASVDVRIRLGVRGGGIGLAVVIAGGGLALTVGLLAHFGSVVGVAAVAAPSWSDGLGMAMLGLAYLPNAVIAAAGYVTGVGFEIGPGTYSPLATSTVDLPAVPLLAAAPDQSGRSLVGLVFLAVPVIAGYLIARTAGRQLGFRLDRMVAAALGGLLTGVLLGIAAAVARGGVGDGRWSVIGTPPLLLGAIAAAEVGIVAAAMAAVIGGKAVPWRPVAASGARGDVGGPVTAIDDDDIQQATDDEASEVLDEDAGEAVDVDEAVGRSAREAEGDRSMDDRATDNDDLVEDTAGRAQPAADESTVDIGTVGAEFTASRDGAPAEGTPATGGLIPEQRRSPEDESPLPGRSAQDLYQRVDDGGHGPAGGRDG